MWLHVSLCCRSLQSCPPMELLLAHFLSEKFLYFGKLYIKFETLIFILYSCNFSYHSSNDPFLLDPCSSVVLLLINYSFTADVCLIINMSWSCFCSKHTHAQPLWNNILAQKPDLWIWLGDGKYLQKGYLLSAKL